MKIDNIDKPEAEILDVAHTGCKAGLALIPVVGGAVFQLITEMGGIKQVIFDRTGNEKLRLKLFLNKIMS